MHIDTFVGFQRIDCCFFNFIVLLSFINDLIHGHDQTPRGSERVGRRETVYIFGVAEGVLAKVVYNSVCGCFSIKLFPESVFCPSKFLGVTLAAHMYMDLI